MSERFGVFVVSNEFNDPAGSTGSTFGSWSAAATPIFVRYAPEVLEQIRIEAVDKFMSIPRGGLEIGGVLFGTIQDTEVTIRAHRPLVLEYETGPSFVLSTKDEDSLRSLLTASLNDHDLQHMTPVGWYHSHTRSEVFLSPEDLAVHDKFFPEHSQIALVVRPVKFQPTRAGFFVREPDGTIRADTSYKEFELIAAPVLERAAGHPPPQTFHVRDEPEPVRIPEALPHSESGSRKKTAILAFASVIAAIAIVLTVIARAKAPVALRLSGSGENIVVEWDRANKEISGATRGALEILDGRAGKVSIPLQPDSLRQGSVTYARTSESVEVRLRLYRDSTITNESVAHFVKPLPPVAEAGSPVPVPGSGSDLAVQVTVPLPKTVPETTERGRVAEPVRRAVLPKAVAARPGAAVMPGIDQAPQITVSGGLPSLLQSTMPVPPPRVQPSTSLPATSRTLASGRAIWTGELRRGGVVMFDNGRASIGAISGRMAPGPVRITAHPAELIDGGMLIYTPRPTGALSEPPSAGNGWNLTVYRHDPRRVRDLAVMETPSEKNNWKLVLRSDAKIVGVIVLDWQEIAGQQAIASNP